MSRPTREELNQIHREVLVRDRPSLLDAKGDASTVWLGNWEMVVIRERDPMPYPDHSGRDHIPGEERSCHACRANVEEYRVPAWVATAIYDRGWCEGQKAIGANLKEQAS